MIRVNRVDKISSVFGRVEGCRGSIWLVASVPDKKALARSKLFDLGLNQSQVRKTCHISIDYFRPIK